MFRILLVITCLTLSASVSSLRGAEADAQPHHAPKSKAHSVLLKCQQVLSPDKHIANPLAVSKRDKKAYRLFSAQIEAIDTVGAHGLVSLVPTLCLFLDYPRDPNLIIAATSRTVARVQDTSAAARFWPAYGVLLQFGDSAVAGLTAFVNNGAHELAYRFAALKVLVQIDGHAAGSASRALLKELEEKDERERLGRAQRRTTGVAPTPLTFIALRVSAGIEVNVRVLSWMVTSNAPARHGRRSRNAEAHNTVEDRSLSGKPFSLGSVNQCTLPYVVPWASQGV